MQKKKNRLPLHEQLQRNQRSIEVLEVKIQKLLEQLYTLKKKRVQIFASEVIGGIDQQTLVYPHLPTVDEVYQQMLRQSEQTNEVKRPSLSGNNDGDETEVQLLIRVTAKEKAMIQANMEQLGFTNFNTYAKKFLIDGCVVQWEIPELDALQREMSYTNRNMNQIVKRANATQSVYLADFQTFKNEWLDLQKKLSDFIRQCRGKMK